MQYEPFQGPYHHFSVIDIQAWQGYSLCSHRDFAYTAEISDYIIDEWWRLLKGMTTYYNIYGENGLSLNRWGVTLIPPESFEYFHGVIKQHTSKAAWKYCEFDLAWLLNLLDKAVAEQKYILHCGV